MSPADYPKSDAFALAIEANRARAQAKRDAGAARMEAVFARQSAMWAAEDAARDERTRQVADATERGRLAAIHAPTVRPELGLADGAQGSLFAPSSGEQGDLFAPVAEKRTR